MKGPPYSWAASEAIARPTTSASLRAGITATIAGRESAPLAARRREVFPHAPEPAARRKQVQPDGQAQLRPDHAGLQFGEYTHHVAVRQHYAGVTLHRFEVAAAESGSVFIREISSRALATSRVASAGVTGSSCSARASSTSTMNWERSRSQANQGSFSTRFRYCPEAGDSLDVALVGGPLGIQQALVQAQESIREQSISGRGVRLRIRGTPSLHGGLAGGKLAGPLRNFFSSLHLSYRRTRVRFVKLEEHEFLRRSGE